ncbi:DNA polymerase IV (plasmid) [Alicyclobacillus fastidiosus]|uniref:DNA polymerase IV n=1 Tax=Alicyclobacillus fastidiosus TaxID=392011 RepID=A0ABY6ZPY6_9BACL|nr:DNA polymerase IV [Alicyclobacillus fastidiosus]WAH44920.1 DNA polymerase IV [Alicyclobacillus fastidiosus]GMA65684.1 DNA polymerase IV 2 [Alicyclobacillus fastidiosus]
MNLVYALCDMQSFYASCEVASMVEYSARRKEFDDNTDPPLVVSGDPTRRSGVVLAATPTAKKFGVSNGIRLGEAQRLVPNLIVVRPHMALYLETSVRIQEIMRLHFPLQEQFSVDEGFIAMDVDSHLFRDPIEAVRKLQAKIWDCFKIRCRIGLGPNKWVAKMTNAKAKKSTGGIVWWTEDDIPTQLHPLKVEEMWGLRRRAETLRREFKADTIGDVARIPVGQLRARFGVWGDVIHRWANGQDISGINPNSYDAAHKGFSHRTTLPRDFYERSEVAVVILELLDEVCHRLRRANQVGRRVGLGVSYERLEGGFWRAKTLSRHTNSPEELYPELLALLDRYWDTRSGVRAVSVAVDMLHFTDAIQLSLFDDVPKRKQLYTTVDEIHERFGETALMRAVSLTKAGQLRDRSRRIGGHYA